MEWHDESAAALETIASVGPSDLDAPLDPLVSPAPVTLEVWNHPIWTCEFPPCPQDFAAGGTMAAIPPNVTTTRPSIDYSFADPLNLDGVALDVNDFATRSRGRFRAPLTGDCTLSLLLNEVGGPPVCPSNCFSRTCDYWVWGGNSCGSMINNYGCDCANCEACRPETSNTGAAKLHVDGAVVAELQPACFKRQDHSYLSGFCYKPDGGRVGPYTTLAEAMQTR